MTDQAPPHSDADDDFGSNAWLVDQMYRRFQDDPTSVSESWQAYFAENQPGADTAPPPPPASATPPPPPASAPVAPAAPPAPAPTPPAASAGETQASDEAPEFPAGGTGVPLRGGAATIAARMDESLELPTATSVRTFPAKLLEVNRKILNNQLARRAAAGKVSFTHLIGWAMVKALRAFPGMNVAYEVVDGQPTRVDFEHVNLGLAMDLPRKGGGRTLLVPNIKSADTMTFHEYWLAYEDIVRRARTGKITPDDFAGTTGTLTNPGTVGTVQSVPRLMPGQGVIVGVGRIGFPPEYEASDPRSLAERGIGRTITMTSTYDHRVIQGAESGMFLRHIHELLLGEHGFYDEIFESMRVPYVPARWAVDANPPPGSQPWAEKQARIFQLINMYRVRGHLIADLDPLRQDPPAIHPELDPLTYGLTIWDLERDFATGGLAGRSRMKLGDILGVVRDAYCRTIGVEYMHIQEPDQKAWIQQHVEAPPPRLDLEEKRRVLRKLNEAEAFERFLHTKFLGAKRFSLEGSESLIPLLDAVVNAAADNAMDEVTLGMAHRGRLNVLANVVGKSLAKIFREFLGEPDVDDEAGGYSGDVKYHLGARGIHTSTAGADIAVEVVANPSHLEAVDPVLEGVVRAKQDAIGAGAPDRVLPLLIHGDAAFSGQGVVAETMNLSQLRGYYTGGTVHVVINNQVGFTTSAVDARSSHYATDVAKAVQAPIFHVNGDDPEAVVRVARLAFAFRQAFHKDVVIDLMCYRRLGHNEGDEPTYTQPRMYKTIENQPSVRRLYMDSLVTRGDITAEEGEAAIHSFREALDAALTETRESEESGAVSRHGSSESHVDTRVERNQLVAIEAKVRELPEGFSVHPKLLRQLTDRASQFAADQIDWATAESLAYGSLALEGHRVRLAGEDSQRGTFSHRHAVLVDYETEAEFTPLEHLHPDQAPIRIYDSNLSEFAAMGFEYGYSVAAPGALVMWEAQFGDFVNGAQVVLDQFVTSGMDKWQQTSSLVILLPHGYEGQGPEHSSARLERFLQNAAEDNMRVAVPSTPAQLFHFLRRQVLHPEKRPLVVMSPKSLLRTKATYSALADLTETGLQRVIADPDVAGGARRVALCAGKIYYDLLAYQQQHEINDVAVVRVEQLYPFPAEELNKVLAPHGDAELVWVQEEPANMGSWRYMSRALFVEGGRSSRGIYRKESASPATGNPKTHTREQAALVAATFT
ncbi:MAG: multifunctional oxoglutarate decarboxylase/oxoglutarate dehydrogenase thiamine pyrophosphate-binding subunit/dihydrolipoyllysine-residue succinyltransferase subunit [Acidimicrobiia bacterium]|nr:multifunctional oxoglutarate decarboxylase/oxoglutarate dehydrogenase thiamine pyrophosphate-binding subunit/dihydrolipoyllysine-residue succinyltransferase subunit [Acidimicrobiia bacterium]